MEARLQRRVQRYGWDLAAADYETLWQSQLARAHAELLTCASLARGERVLDVACGTGLVRFDAARAVGKAGRVVGVDLSDRMLDAARHRAQSERTSNVDFARMDAESLALPDASFDVTLCALGLMYLPDPARAVREMRRVLRPGGRIVIAVWGERSRCGWSELFSIIDAEVAGDVCPMFFCLGQEDTLVRLCADTGLEAMTQRRVGSVLNYADANEACNAAFLGGPVALAWSRFDAQVRARIRTRYLQAIEGYRDKENDSEESYGIPGEFVIVAARCSESGSESAPRWAMGVTA